MSLAFNERKHNVISELVEEMDPNNPDKSPKGYVDAPILDLMRLINQHSQFYTTSSCSGRVAVYCEGVDEKKRTASESSKSTKGGKWLYVTHDPVEIPDIDTKEKKRDWILKLLFGDEYERLTTKSIEDEHIAIKRQLVFFKFEPLVSDMYWCFCLILCIGVADLKRIRSCMLKLQAQRQRMSYWDWRM
jgi:tRNA wybutosine-synthesizing protein 3